jgi:hypothetical protein
MMTFLAPEMLGHPMDIAAALRKFTGLGKPAGAVMHFVLGSIGFPIGYLIIGPYAHGPGWLHGVTFLVAVWFLADLIAMPILGVGLFFGGAEEAMAALLGARCSRRCLGLGRTAARPIRPASAVMTSVDRSASSFSAGDGARPRAGCAPRHPDRSAQLPICSSRFAHEVFPSSRAVSIRTIFMIVWQPKPDTSAPRALGSIVSIS